MIHAPVNLLHFQMKAAAPSDVKVSQLWKNASGVVVPTRDAIISDSRMFRQKFPLAIIHSMDAWRLLDDWAESFMDPLDYFEDELFGILASCSENDCLVPEAFDKANVLDNMLDAVAEETGISDRHSEAPSPNERLSLFESNPLEMVGLIPKGREVPAPEVLALGLFSRGQLKDDSRGSLLRVIEEQYVKQGARPWWGRPKKLNVFAIEGLVDAPGLPMSASSLLSKIQKYAHKEQKIVVVPSWARIGSDGQDLSEYYVRLGFEKVEMEDGLHEYVYTGTSPLAEDVWASDEQIIVGMNLWTGLPRYGSARA